MINGCNCFRNAGATCSSTSIVSTELHTEGRDTLAFTTIFTAFLIAASFSTYTWQTPAPVSITGTKLFFLTNCISESDPRGISTSTYLVAVNNSCTVSRSTGNSVTQSGSISFAFNTFLMRRIAAWLVFSASLLPLSKQPFWLRKQSAAISKVTFGLDSYIAPTMPNGTVIFSSNNPLSRRRFSSVLREGLGNRLIFLILLAMPAIRSLFNNNRSTRGLSGSCFATSS